MATQEIGEGEAVKILAEAWSSGDDEGCGLPVAGSAPSLDRIRVVGGVSGGSGEPHLGCPGPPPPLYDAVRRRPTNHGSIGHLRSGRGSRPRLGRWTESGGDQPNILPP